MERSIRGDQVMVAAWVMVTSPPEMNRAVSNLWLVLLLLTLIAVVVTGKYHQF